MLLELVVSTRNERELVPVERVRTSARMFERMVDYGRQRHDSGPEPVEVGGSLLVARFVDGASRP